MWQGQFVDNVIVYDNVTCPLQKNIQTMTNIHSNYVDSTFSHCEAWRSRRPSFDLWAARACRKSAPESETSRSSLAYSMIAVDIKGRSAPTKTWKQHSALICPLPRLLTAWVIGVLLRKASRSCTLRWLLQLTKASKWSFHHHFSWNSSVCEPSELPCRLSQCPLMIYPSSSNQSSSCTEKLSRSASSSWKVA